MALSEYRAHLHIGQAFGSPGVVCIADMDQLLLVAAIGESLASLCSKQSIHAKKPQIFAVLTGASVLYYN